MKYEITNNGVLKNCVPEETETELQLPDGILVIGEYAFRRWNHIKKLLFRRE